MYPSLVSLTYSFISHLLNIYCVRNVLGLGTKVKKNDTCPKELIYLWEGQINNQIISVQCDPAVMKTHRSQLFLIKLYFILSDGDVGNAF